MENFTDNSRYLTMIKNRPSLGLIPLPNKRLLGQRYATQIFMFTTVASLMSILYYKFIVNGTSLSLLKTRK